MRFLALSACVAAFAPKHDPLLSARGRRAPKRAVVEAFAQADVRIDDEADVRIDDEALALFDRGCAALDAGECSSAAAQLRRSVELDATRARLHEDVRLVRGLRREV